MQIRATSPKPATTSHRNRQTRLVLDTDDFNTAFTDQQLLVQLLSFVVQTPTRESLENALTQGGFDLDVAEPETPDPLTRTAMKYQTLLDTSLSPEQAAYMLDTSEEEVLGQLEARSFYGVHTDEGWKLPRFQFEGNRPLPGIGEVIPLLHTELHPIAVRNWFTAPSTDLLVGDRELSPRQWLLEGRSADAVARLAIDL